MSREDFRSSWSDCVPYYNVVALEVRYDLRCLFFSFLSGAHAYSLHLLRFYIPRTDTFQVLKKFKQTPNMGLDGKTSYLIECSWFDVKDYLFDRLHSIPVRATLHGNDQIRGFVCVHLRFKGKSKSVFLVAPFFSGSTLRLPDWHIGIGFALTKIVVIGWSKVKMKEGKFHKDFTVGWRSW